MNFRLWLPKSKFVGLSCCTLHILFRILTCFVRPKQTDVAVETPVAVVPAPVVEEKTETVFTSVSAAEKTASKVEVPTEAVVAKPAAASTEPTITPVDAQKGGDVVADGLEKVSINDTPAVEAGTTKKKKKKSSYMDF